MDVVISHAASLRGTLTLPGDKAICHRAILGSALASGVTEIAPWSSAVDCLQTLELVKRLGVGVTASPERLRIEGVGAAGLRAPSEALDCGESGTTMRLAAGVLAGQPIAATLTGSPSLQRRPMRRIVEPLTAMGATIRGGEHPSQAATIDVYPPLQIQGRRPLGGITYRMPVASAQVKSAILFAGLASREPVTIIEPSVTRDHTERLLRLLGVGVEHKGTTVRMEPPSSPLQSPGRLMVPGDISSAAFFVVAASVISESSLTFERVSLNPTRIYYLEILRRMGARIRLLPDDDRWERQGRLMVESAPLRAISVGAAEVPLVIDELPALMVAACAAEGTSRFEGLAELRVKETDRVQSMIEGLRALGAGVELIGEEGLQISPGRLRGATVDCFNDHRTAMSLAIAGLLAQGQTTLRGAECVEKSFGTFFDVLSEVAGSGSVQVL